MPSADRDRDRASAAIGVCVTAGGRRPEECGRLILKGGFRGALDAIQPFALPWGECGEIGRIGCSLRVATSRWPQRWLPGPEVRSRGERRSSPGVEGERCPLWDRCDSVE